jgi:hypothetical protein
VPDYSVDMLVARQRSFDGVKHRWKIKALVVAVITGKGLPGLSADGVR